MAKEGSVEVVIFSNNNWFIKQSKNSVEKIILKKHIAEIGKAKHEELVQKIYNYNVIPSPVICEWLGHQEF